MAINGGSVLEAGRSLAADTAPASCPRRPLVVPFKRAGVAVTATTALQADDGVVPVRPSTSTC